MVPAPHHLCSSLAQARGWTGGAQSKGTMISGTINSHLKAWGDLQLKFPKQVQSDRGVRRPPPPPALILPARGTGGNVYPGPYQVRAGERAGRGWR